VLSTLCCAPQNHYKPSWKSHGTKTRRKRSKYKVHKWNRLSCEGQRIKNNCMLKARRKSWSRTPAAYPAKPHDSSLSWLRDQEQSLWTRWKRCQRWHRPRMLHRRGCLSQAWEGRIAQQGSRRGRRPQPAPGHGALLGRARPSARAWVSCFLELQRTKPNHCAGRGREGIKKKGGCYFTCMIFKATVSWWAALVILEGQ